MDNREIIAVIDLSLGHAIATEIVWLQPESQSSGRRKKKAQRGPVYHLRGDSENGGADCLAKPPLRNEMTCRSSERAMQLWSGAAAANLGINRSIDRLLKKARCFIAKCLGFWKKDSTNERTKQPVRQRTSQRCSNIWHDCERANERLEATNLNASMLRPPIPAGNHSKMCGKVVRTTSEGEFKRHLPVSLSESDSDRDSDSMFSAATNSQIH